MTCQLPKMTCQSSDNTCHYIYGKNTLSLLASDSYYDLKIFCPILKLLHLNFHVLCKDKKKITLTLHESLEETKIERNEQNLKTFGT